MCTEGGELLIFPELSDKSGSQSIVVQDGKNLESDGSLEDSG